MKNFESLNLFNPVQRALQESNYTCPSPIQSLTIPPAMEGADILGCAKTGTGKTAAFALPILHYLGVERPAIRPNKPVALVLAPTRELAIQIAASVQKYGKYVQFRQAVVYGGVSQATQVAALRRGVDLLIATPGRLLDLMKQGHVDLSAIDMFVLDEADRMFDMGFLPSLRKIVSSLPRNRQSLFFSATMPSEIRALTSQLLYNPVVITVQNDSAGADRILQSVRFVKREEKLSLLIDRLAQDGVDQAIVFTRTKRAANDLAKKLDKAGILAAAIHGNKSQSYRQKTLDAFRQLNVKVLVATDVASRGIDVNGITHVFNFDVPVEPESYIHRIGRTGRAGEDGIAVTFCTIDEMDQFRAIERIAKGRLRMENPEARFISNLKTGNNGPSAVRSSNSKRKGKRRFGAFAGAQNSPRGRNANRQMQPR